MDLFLQGRCSRFSLICSSSPCGAVVGIPLVASSVSWPLSVLCCGSLEGEHMDLIPVFSVFSVCPPWYSRVRSQFGSRVSMQRAWGKHAVKVSQARGQHAARVQRPSFLSSLSLSSRFHFQSGFNLVPDTEPGFLGRGTRNQFLNAFCFLDTVSFELHPGESPA